MGMDGATIANAFCKMASRLRETHDFKTLYFRTSVSPTRNTHFQNQVSSRLRETLLFLKTWRLVHTKRQVYQLSSPDGRFQALPDVDFCAQAAEIVMVVFATLTRFARFEA